MSSQLTVVVPMYNVEKYLEKCIYSLLNQTLKIEEIILVDDGSKDRCGEIADEFASKYDNIKVVHQKNGGLSAARNTGINLSTQKYIAFVDSDDYIEPTMYEILMKRLIGNDADISIGGVWYEQENGDKYSPYEPGINKLWNKKESLIELNTYKYFNMAAWDAIYKKELFDLEGYGEKKLRFPEGKLCEDFYLMHQIVARTNRVTYTSEPLYHYIQRENSISRNKKINLAPMDASDKQLEFYNKWFPELKDIAETACFFAYASIFTTYCRQGEKCPNELLEDINKTCHKYFKNVMKNRYIPRIKKVQAIVFCCSKSIYKKIVQNKEHR